jgi:hypothetical protein
MVYNAWHNRNEMETVTVFYCLGNQGKKKHLYRLTVCLGTMVDCICGCKTCECGICAAFDSVSTNSWVHQWPLETTWGMTHRDPRTLVVLTTLLWAQSQLCSLTGILSPFHSDNISVQTLPRDRSWLTTDRCHKYHVCPTEVAFSFAISSEDYCPLPACWSWQLP